MKPLMIFFILSLFISVTAQTGYVWERMTFNTAGGEQTSSNYNALTSIGEKVQGEIAGTNYNGLLGFLFLNLDVRLPKITSIIDVPHDQGLKVQVIWNKCGFDDVYAIDTFYSLWRKDTTYTACIANIKQKVSNEKMKTTNLSTSIEIYTDPNVIVEKYRENPKKKYFWQRDNDIWIFVAQIPALNYDEYAYIALTLQDSSSTGTHYFAFKTVYHDSYQYYESLPDSGYSVDNIAPDQTRVTIAKNGNNVKLSWDKVEYGTYNGNRYPELNGVWYKIYADTKPNFICNSSTYFTTVTDLEYNVPIGLFKRRFFKIIVSDKP